MNAWRGLFAFGLVLLVACPLLRPFGEVADPAVWKLTTAHAVRFLHLGLNTLLLSACTLALALPLGIALAVLLFRGLSSPHSMFLILLALALFIPLPIFVSSWQAMLGADGWLPLESWRGGDRPWATGWVPAIWIHGFAAVPWVAFIVGVGLTWVEPELEEEAAQIVGPWQVLLRVTLPRVRTSILAAALFVVLQTAAEISVTDMMLIATLAEEVVIQFPLGDRAGLARTLVISLPGLLLVWGVVLATLARLEKTLPPLMPTYRSSRLLEPGFAWQRVLGQMVLFVLIALPLASLLWKVGLTDYPPRWEAGVAWHFLRAETILLGRDLLASLLLAFVAGMLTAAIALAGCWLARDCRWLRGLLFSVLTWAWVLPGPVVGIGLHETIMDIVQRLPNQAWANLTASLFYYGPSPLPLAWAQMLRALPIAVVFLWPIVRMIPREQFEAARLEGASALGEFTHVVLPMTWRGGMVTGLASSALCLGEVAASMRVETPGWDSYMKLLFDRMHYGIGNNEAALGVMMLGTLAGGALLFVAGKWLVKCVLWFCALFSHDG